MKDLVFAALLAPVPGSLTLAQESATGVAINRDAAAQEPATGVVMAPEMVRRGEELKWGMFICWSFSTFSGHDWSPGIKDPKFFATTEMDTDQWAQTAKDAQMGYILMLTKHHDGFCHWDTKTTDRKVTQVPLGKDVLASLRKNCDLKGYAAGTVKAEWSKFIPPTLK